MAEIHFKEGERMISREEIMDKLIDATLSNSPKSSIDFEIDSSGSSIDEINGVILKILSVHEGNREIHIKVKM